jgi:hypothetical protein
LEQQVGRDVTQREEGSGRRSYGRIEIDGKA